MLRTLVGMLGCVAILVGIIADWIGLGQPGSLGTGQVLLILLGLSLLLIGLLGKRVLDLYRTAAIILLNTLVLLTLFELAAIVFARLGGLPSYTQIIHRTYPDLPYYAVQDWTETYWREATRAENYRYEPFAVWKHLPFEGETITIDKQGRRRTPEAECTLDAYKVFVFGGSTMWGWGSPDWGTIAAYLQTGLQAQTDEPVCVVNFGEDGYVSTQNVIVLIRQLQTETVPDAVIFYDGFNDILAAYQSGAPGVHVALSDVAAKYEEREPPLIKWLKSSRLFSLTQRLAARLAVDRQPGELGPAHQITGMDATRLADSVSQVYLENARVVRALAQEYGFDVYLFWQPYLGIGDKPLTEHELAIWQRMDPTLFALAEQAYHNMALTDPAEDRIWTIADVFDEQEAQIWIDEWGHITPEGNQLVAEEMLAVIR